MLVVYAVFAFLQCYFWTYFWSLPQGIYDWVHITIMTVLGVFTFILIVGELAMLITDGGGSYDDNDYYYP